MNCTATFNWYNYNTIYNVSCKLLYTYHHAKIVRELQKSRYKYLYIGHIGHTGHMYHLNKNLKLADAIGVSQSSSIRDHISGIAIQLVRRYKHPAHATFSRCNHWWEHPSCCCRPEEVQHVRKSRHNSSVFAILWCPKKHGAKRSDPSVPSYW